MISYRTDRTACRRRTGNSGWIPTAVSAGALLAMVLAGTAVGADGSGANAPASASEPSAIVVSGDVKYCNQQPILIRYRWTGTPPKGVQMWISLDGTQWLPWQWSDKPADGFTFSPPRQGKILIALASAEHETAALPSGGYQSLAIVFDWDKPLLRLISSEVVSSPKSGVALRLTWAAYDENAGERPMSLHWRRTAEEPWQLALADLPNNGACEWPIPIQLAGKDLEVSLRATDLAGNSAEAICPVAGKAMTGASATPPLAAARHYSASPGATSGQGAGDAKARHPGVGPEAGTPSSQLASPGTPSAAGAEAERLCELAQQYIGQNEFDQAEDMLREAVQTDPTYYAARLSLGILLQRRSRHAEAIGEYQAVLAVKPDNATAWRNLALAYMTVKDYGKARGTLQKLIAVEGDNPQTWIDLGDVEMLMGRPESARQCWEKAKSISKPNSDTATRAGKRLGAYGK